MADLIDAKLCDYSGQNLPREAGKVIERFHNTVVSISDVRARLPPTFVEPGIKERWIFGARTAKRIERLRLAIESTKSSQVRRFFRVALAGLLVELSNVRIDGKGRRYRRNWQARPVEPDEVIERFLDAVRLMIEDVHRYSSLERPASLVLRGDSRELLERFTEKVDAVIFSPPYPNSFDYTDIYNVELWMLGYLAQAADNKSLRLKTMRSHVQVSWQRPVSEATGILKQTLDLLEGQAASLWDARLPRMVHAYFEDLISMLHNIHRCLTPRGHVVIVVGDSSYAGIRIDCAGILAENVGALGFEFVDKQSVRVMRSSVQQRRGEKILDEWLIRLRRSD